MKKSDILKLGILALSFVMTSCGTQNNGDFDPSKNINLYSRESGSGTRECFFETIGYGEVKKDNLFPDGVTVKFDTSNAAIMNSVGSDLYAIGYCSLDSVTSVSSIKAIKYENVEASRETVLNNEYKLKRNFNYVVRSDYSGIENGAERKEAAKGFIDFLLNTNEGQSVITSNGGIVNDRNDLKKFSDIEKNYSIFSDTAKSVEVRFCGSTSVEKIIKAAAEKLQSLIKNKNLKYTLSQSGSGDAVSGITEGKNGVKSDIGFLSREINDDELALLTEDNSRGAFAIDAVVPIVNVNNTFYTKTTAAELTSLYKGEIKTWSDLVK